MDPLCGTGNLLHTIINHLDKEIAAFACDNDVWMTKLTNMVSNLLSMPVEVFLQDTLNLTQKDLAKILKVSNHIISNWETGKSMPSYELLIPLTKELGISITELINGEFESNKEEPNKVVEKTIKFLKHIDEDKKKKNRIIGTIIIIIGFLIKIVKSNLSST
jgi:transcriptional regulator with XRE-family HTH domain